MESVAPNPTEPLSHFLLLPNIDHYGVLAGVVASIDSVHEVGAGLLKPVPVVWDEHLSSKGRFRTDGNGWVEIALSTQLLYVEMGEVLCHEVGHLLDAMITGFRGFASEQSPEFETLRAVVDATAPVQRLRELVGHSEIESPIGTLRLNQDIIRYHLKYPELFARGYVQYIASSSGNADLGKWLQLECSTPLHAIYPTQWTDQEFEPVHREMDAVFGRREWLIKSRN